MGMLSLYSTHLFIYLPLFYFILFYLFWMEPHFLGLALSSLCNQAWPRISSSPAPPQVLGRQGYVPPHLASAMEFGTLYTLDEQSTKRATSQLKNVKSESLVPHRS